jgi:hypothetical protein
LRGAYRWDADNGWLPTAASGACGTDTTVNFAVDNRGSVYGLSWNSCTDYRAFRWNPRQGSVLLPSPQKNAAGAPVNTRINQVSANGETLVGWMEDPLQGIWYGVVWNSGEPSLVLTADGEPVDEVTAVSGDGKLIGGDLFDGQLPLGDGYRRRAGGGPIEFVQPLPGDAAPAQPFAMSMDGNVMVGFSGNPFLSLNPAPFIWTRQMGTMNLDEFVRGQGTVMEQWYSLWEPTSVSDDGRSIAGWGYGFLGPAGWVLRIDTAFVCHQAAGTQGGQTPAGQSVSVQFPEEFNEHLARGDTVGRCSG